MSTCSPLTSWRDGHRDASSDWILSPPAPSMSAEVTDFNRYKKGSKLREKVASSSQTAEPVTTTTKTSKPSLEHVI